MAYKLIYIDDDSSDRVKGTVSGFSKKDILEIIALKPLNSLEKQVVYIEQFLKKENINGLILDLRLDDYKNEDGKNVQFRGTTLAQEIRTRQREGSIKAFPIFLFSGNDKIAESLDAVGENSFDICIEKESINDKLFPFYRNRFCSIIEAYDLILKEENIRNILGINNDGNIDDQFLSDINFQKQESKTITSFVNFFIKQVLEKNGVLISEKLLAARLGVEIDKSSDWIALKRVIESTKYNGVMSSSWDRWWMNKLENWWKDTIDSRHSLRCTSAHYRVSKLKEVLNLTNLVAAEKIEKSSGLEYWTLCAAYDSPLDPIDGLMVINQDNLYPWQDINYVSIDGALRRKNIDSWHGVSKMEETRLEELQELYSKKR